MLALYKCKDNRMIPLSKMRYKLLFTLSGTKEQEVVIPA